MACDGGDEYGDVLFEGAADAVYGEGEGLRGKGWGWMRVLGGDVFGG